MINDYINDVVLSTGADRLVLPKGFEVFDVDSLTIEHTTDIDLVQNKVMEFYVGSTLVARAKIP